MKTNMNTKENYVQKMLDLPPGKQIIIDFVNMPEDLEEVYIGGHEKVFDNKVPAKRKVLTRDKDLIALAKFSYSHYLVELYREVAGQYQFIKSFEEYPITKEVKA